GISMEVKGHTDDRGADDYNMELSKKRAQAVYNYMIQRGVSRSKLTYSYYGKTQPIESNETDEGRRMNRRVEFEIK
ncbi:MAG: OmpA family protein, partial [Prevotella sp.]|nr:OmpA family protein [Prevotella sp.]